MSAEPPLLDEVRKACAWVAERARSVRIAGDPADYAAQLLASHAGEAFGGDWDQETHFAGEVDATIAYVLTLDSINFGSGYFPHLQKRPGMSGYFTVASCLKDRFDSKGPFSAQELRNLTPHSVAELFEQETGDALRDELMQHFAAALNALGGFVEDRYGGSFTSLVEAARGSAERLAALLLEMPYFRDIAIYEGREVPLLKRAQITPSDLALALGGSPPADFGDLDRLTIFADNLVPHVLRLDGLTRYDPALVDRLERGEPLPAGSPEEVEIRAVALHAVELMVAGLSARGEQVSARELDILLWNRGQAARYRGGSKHRTRTVYY